MRSVISETECDPVVPFAAREAWTTPRLVAVPAAEAQTANASNPDGPTNFS
jgi:hypothetical protein